MENNNWSLEKAKKFIKNFVGEKTDYYMIVKNKETEQEGCAIITKDKKVAVFEGKDDGSEDRIYSQKDFLSRNDISLWDKNSKNYGKYVKIFQADGQINTDNFTKIISSYYVWNRDITNYFEKMKVEKN